MASDSIDGLLAERATLRINNDLGASAAGGQQLEKLAAEEAAYTSAGGYDVPQAPEAPQDVPYPTPMQPAPRQRELLPEYIRGEGERPRRWLESPAEVVRDRAGLPIYRPNLRDTAETAKYQALTEINDVLHGKKPGLLKTVGGEKIVGAVAEKLGLDPEQAVRIADAALIALNLPSTTSGLAVADILKQAGVESEKADQVGLATTVVGSLLWAAGGGIGTLKDLRAALPSDVPVAGEGETQPEILEVEVAQKTGAETEAG